jgi:hypothetical protein
MPRVALRSAFARWMSFCCGLNRAQRAASDCGSLDTSKCSLMGNTRHSPRRVPIVSSHKAVVLGNSGLEHREWQSCGWQVAWLIADSNEKRWSVVHSRNETLE